MSTPPPTTPAPPQKPSPEQKLKQSPVFVSIINELNLNVDQLLKRQKLISEIETILSNRYGAQNKLISYIVQFNSPKSGMNVGDLPSWEAVLASVSGAEQINVVLHSPGGDGSIVEKIVDMCRSHLSGTNRKLRMIVPNIAKSAASVMSLGADKILMGYSSELGPIDPQIVIVVSGVTQQVSALSFVEARDVLMDQITKAIKAKQPTLELLSPASEPKHTFYSGNGAPT